MLSDEGDTLVLFYRSLLVLVELKVAIEASMLVRMYMMWGEKYGYKIKELNYQGGGCWYKTVTLGLKAIILSVT
jgi:peptide chain release factor 2